MKTIKFSVLLILTFGLLFVSCTSIEKEYNQHVQNFLPTKINAQAIDTLQLDSVPTPIKHFLKNNGWLGKTQIESIYLKFDGEMKLSAEKDWTPIDAEQYSFTNEPTRLFFIQAKSIKGLDSYINGKGRMHIKLFNTFTLVDEQSKEMDEAALVTYLNDLCLLYPTELLKENIELTELDDYHVKVSLNHNNNRVIAILSFNKEYELINFMTNNRYYQPMDADSAVNIPWSTPIYQYQTINGVKVPAQAEAKWHFEDSTFTYARFTIQDLKYNIGK